MVNLDKARVDFLGIGAEKSGSTWLADMLRKHPEVYVPPKKEIYFFNEYDPHFLKVKNPKYFWGIEWYLNHFLQADKKRINGEFSPTYLYSEKTAYRIFKHFPNVKLFVVLRDPVERAFSQYIQDKRFGLLNGMDFTKALRKNDTYIEKGLYFKYISIYLKIFPENNLKIILLDDIKDKPQKILKEAFSFLGLCNTNFYPEDYDRKRNPAKKARFVGINKFMISKEYALRNSKYDWLLRYLETSGIRQLAITIREMNSVGYDRPPKLSKSKKRKLYKYFEKDIKKLEKLIKRDLSGWY